MNKYAINVCLGVFEDDGAQAHNLNGMLEQIETKLVESTVVNAVGEICVKHVPFMDEDTGEEYQDEWTFEINGHFIAGNLEKANDHVMDIIIQGAENNGLLVGGGIIFVEVNNG